MVNGRKPSSAFSIPEKELITSNKQPAGLFNLFINEGNNFGTKNPKAKKRRFKIPSRPDMGFDEAFMPRDTQFLADGTQKGRKLTRLFK